MLNSDWFLRQRYFAWTLMIVLYCLWTLINGYPILYSDTSTYLSSGFELEAPADRPITYGLLLRIFSLNGLSLFLIPIFHSLVFLYVLYKLLSLFFNEKQAHANLFLIALCVLLFSGFGWSINLLLPDVFTPVGFICLYCILAGNNSIKRQAFLFVILFLSTASHISNLFVFLLITVLAFSTRKVFFGHIGVKLFRNKIILILVQLVISYFIMSSAISKSKHVFMMGNLAQKGILQEVLKDSCESSNFKLCRYKDSIPRSFEYFVWSDQSPIVALGGWKSTKPEFKRIIGISFSNTKYLKMHAVTSFDNLLAQLATFGIAEGTGPFGPETMLVKRIRKFTLLDDETCLKTWQFEPGFGSLAALNTFYKTALILAMLHLCYQLFKNYRKIDVLLKGFLILMVILILSNSALVAYGSEVSNRYGCKIAWMLILSDLILFLRLNSDGAVDSESIK